MLSGSQQQMAGNKVDSMAHEAGELSQEERSQAARIDKLVHEAQQLSSSDPGTPDLDKLHSLMQERDALASERQQLSDELSKLQANMRNATRDLAANQPEPEVRMEAPAHPGPSCSSQVWHGTESPGLSTTKAGFVLQFPLADVQSEEIGGQKGDSG